MKVYNTLTRKKENFKPKRQDSVKVYYCGPTPYNYAHIWNLRTYLFEDIIVRTLNYLWYKTKTVMNITDIDDKTIRISRETWESLLDFTKRYSRIFLDDITKLRVKKADIIDPISNLIPEMVRMINTLLKKWYAYYSEEDWSIYFNIKKFKKYWELAHLDMLWMKESVRVNNDEYEKENASDFALWKGYNKENDWENFWEEIFIIEWNDTKIKWRPGWHIECSACNMKHLWKEIDVHMWWIDNLFPHHQNEVAQTESCTGKTFSRYWIHWWHLLVDWQKMAKSKNNFYTLRDLEKHYSNLDNDLLYRWFRLVNLMSHYRKSLDFSFKRLDQSIETIKWFDNILKTIKNTKPKFEWIRAGFREAQQIFITDFIKSLEDDFNLPSAMSVVFDFHTFVNTELNSWNISKEEINSILDMLKNFNEILDLYNFDLLENKNIPEEILELAKLRDNARVNKDYELSDKYRDKILKLWYKIIDTKDWTVVE